MGDLSEDLSEVEVTARNIMGQTGKKQAASSEEDCTQSRVLKDLKDKIV